MRQHVLFEFIASIVTFRTGRGFFILMRPHVPFKVFFVNATIDTYRTSKDFFSSMSTHMLCKMFSFYAFIITFQTSKRFFFGVSPHVFSKEFFLGANVVTFRTIKGSFRSMSVHVLFDITYNKVVCGNAPVGCSSLCDSRSSCRRDILRDYAHFSYREVYEMLSAFWAFVPV